MEFAGFDSRDPGLASTAQALPTSAYPTVQPYARANVDRYGFAGLAQARAQSGPPRSEEAHGSPTLLWLSDIARQAAMCCARPTITRPGGSMSAALELRSQA